MIATQRWLRMSGSDSLGDSHERGVADLRYYNAEYCEWGDGPPLVVVPGLAGGISLIEPLARALAPRFRVIAYQLRGETDCFALRRSFDLADLANDLAEFVRARGLETPAVLGVSFGGVIALSAAARFRRLFSAVAVQGVGMKFEPGLIQRIASLVLNSYPLPCDSPFLNQFFNVLFGGRPPAAALDHAISCCWQTDQSVMNHRLRLLRRMSLEQVAADVSRPTLVLAGSRDAIVSTANAHALVEQIPDCHLTVIGRAGHLAPVSHSVETASIVTHFLSAAGV